MTSPGLDPETSDPLPYPVRPSQPFSSGGVPAVPNARCSGHRHYPPPPPNPRLARVLGHPAVVCRSTGPGARRTLRGVRGRRGRAAVRTLRGRLPLALPLSRRRRSARVSAGPGRGRASGRGRAGAPHQDSSRPGSPEGAPSLAPTSSPKPLLRSPGPPCAAEPAPETLPPPLGRGLPLRARPARLP